MPRIATHNAVASPSQSFLLDVIRILLPFSNLRNLLTWTALTLATVIAAWVPLMGGFLSLIMLLYLAAFALNSVVSSAAGEKELPDVWIQTFWDDLLLPCVQLVGTWLFCLLPLWAGKGWYWYHGMDCPQDLHRILEAISVILWPATVLEVAIGGTLSAARPDMTLRTILAAPVPYAVVCGILGLSVWLWHQAATAFQSTDSPHTFLFVLVADLVTTAISVYATIVATQAVGLYYQHFRNRLPWRAE